MPRKLREPFEGHPGAILFLRISGEGVFQQPQAITLTTRVKAEHQEVLAPGIPALPRLCASKALL